MRIQNKEAAERLDKRLRSICCLRAAILSIYLVTIAAAQELKLDKEALQRAQTYEPYITESAARHGVDARLLWVIAYLETSFNPQLVSRKGARGLMQLMPATAERFGVRDPHDPVAAINAAAKYVQYLTNRFYGRADLVLAAYNSGEETVKAYKAGQSIRIGSKVINPGKRITGGIPPYRETRNYVMAGLNILSLLARSSSSIYLSRGETVQKRDDKSGEGFAIAQKKARKGVFHREQTESTVPSSPSTKSLVRRSIVYSVTVE